MIEDRDDQIARQLGQVRAEISLQAERQEARIRALHVAVKNLQFEVVLAVIFIVGMLYATR